MIEEYTTVFFKRHGIPVFVVDKLGKSSDGKQWYLVETEEPDPDFTDGGIGGAFQTFECTEDELENLKEAEPER